MSEMYNLTAPCLLGIEGMAADEFKRMGFEDAVAENGRVKLKGDASMIARANLNSRLAERILIEVGSFTAHTFTELFDGVKALEWERYIGKKDAFPVNGWSLDSALHSIPDCQSIIKKAIVDRLSLKYNISWFEETEIEYKIRFSIKKDFVTLMIDTSGDGLHKRGYRKNSSVAPIKETLAAAMCELARIYPDTVLLDPMCGSGTLLIESALMATNTAVGLNRYFAAERFGFIDRQAFRDERSRALDLIERNVTFNAHGFDIDGECVSLTLANAKKAGMEKYITATQSDFKDFKLPSDRCTVITNPPYGERLLDIKAAESIYKLMGEKFIKESGKKYFIISPDDDFERIFGRTADKRRKLYNGMIKCQIYMYFKSGVSGNC